MSRRLLWALLLIAISVIILIANTSGRATVGLIPGLSLDLSGIRAIIYFCFISLGVVIGILLK